MAALDGEREGIDGVVGKGGPRPFVPKTRIAPKGGYDFPEKSLYRRQFWNYATRQLQKTGIDASTAHALLMPSLEGIEIDVALSKGFILKNLHIVDNNPAIVATLARRFPGINTYGISVERALSERIPKVGIKLSIVNLDLTGSFSMARIKAFQEMFGGSDKVLAPTCIIGVTTLRGRETSFVRRYEEMIALDDPIYRDGFRKYFKKALIHADGEITDLDTSRALLQFCHLGRAVNRRSYDERIGVYKSTLPMMWIAGTFRRTTNPKSR